MRQVLYDHSLGVTPNDSEVVFMPISPGRMKKLNWAEVEGFAEGHEHGAEASQEEFPGPPIPLTTTDSTS